MANEVSIEVGAIDTASPVVERVRQTTERNAQQMQRAWVVLDQYGRAFDSISRAMNSQAGAAGNSAAKASQIEREFSKLTSGAGYAAQGLQTLRGAMNSLLWGSLMGAAIAAASKLIEYAFASNKAAISTDELNKAILDGSLKYGLLSKSQREVTESTIALFNAELEVAQFRATRDLGGIKEKISALQEENRIKSEASRKNAELLETMEASHPLYLSTVAAFAKQTESVLENNLAIVKLKSNEQNLNQILQTKKATLESVAAATGNLTDHQLEQEAAGRVIQQQAVRELRERAAAQESLGRAILDAALIQRRDAGAAQEALGRSILAAAQMQQRNNAATQEAIGLSIQMAGVLEQQQFAQERLLQVQKFNTVNVVNPFQGQEEETRRLIAAYNDLLIATSGLDAGQALFNLTLQTGFNFYAAMANATQAWILGQQKFGPAIRAATAQVLASLAAEAAVRAIMATALGFYHLANFNPAGAAAAFTSAQQYALVGAVAGIAARQLANSARLGGGPIGSSTNPAVTREATPNSSNTGAGQAMNITVQVNALDPSSVDWDRISQNIAESLGRHLGRGGSTGPVQISFERN